MKRILVTGGAGYIGSHTVFELLGAGYEVLVVDNLSNSGLEAVKRVEEVSGRSVRFCQLDVRDKPALTTLFAESPVDAVIHFAALKAVGESVAQPLRYYDNNVGGTLALCEVMQDFGVTDLVFSSSCTVYGDSAKMPLHEEMPLGQATNP